ncbi:MAG: ATP-binding protein [Planctomycetota bacterium]|nr:ATP-binding protein [Planctomycetota bacterium]
MSLRAKCALLLVAFEVTLAATIFFTMRYIGIYFEEAADAFSVSRAHIADITRLRGLTRSELAHLSNFVPNPSSINEAERLGREIDVAAARIADTLQPDAAAELRARLAVKERAVTDFLNRARSAGDSKPAAIGDASHRKLDTRLGSIESQERQVVEDLVHATFAAQEKSILILSINMFVGAGLGIFGLVLVRNWVLLPIQELKTATDELGRGNLDHRARVRSKDELGQLAEAVNKMSADLAQIERRMIQRERLAAMGELISYVAHNIRNPLAGIQSSVDACRRELDAGSPVRGHHDDIVAAIDKMRRWLREIEHTCRPLDVEAKPVQILDIIDNVIAVFRPMAERHSVEILGPAANGIRPVVVDRRHFEQALAAVVGNAVEVLKEGGRITIAASQDGDTGHWTLTVSDSGPGIDPDIRKRIFEPSFSTKRTGSGLGLTLAKKVVELHGGELTVECPRQGGSVFRFNMPFEPGTRGSHG